MQETTNISGYLLPSARTGFARIKYTELLSATGSLLGTSESRKMARITLMYSIIDTDFCE